MQAIVKSAVFRDITFQPQGLKGKPAFRIKLDECSILTGTGARIHEQVLVMIPAFGNDEALTKFLGDSILHYRMWMKEHEGEKKP